MLQYTSMNLNEIREMDYYDFQVHLRLAMAKENIEREFRMALQGIDPKAKKKVTKEDVLGNADNKMSRRGTIRKHIKQRFDPTTGGWKDV